MSGPKGYSYSVVSAEELQRREDLARSGRCDQLVSQLKALIARLERYGVKTGMVAKPKTTTHENLITWENELKAAIAKTEKLINIESDKRILQRIKASQGEVDVSRVSLGLNAKSRQKKVSASADESRSKAQAAAAANAANAPDIEARQRIAKDVGLVAKSLAKLKDEAQQEKLSALAGKILESTDVAQAKGDLLTLKTDVNNALQTQTNREAALDVILDIAHLQGEDALNLRNVALNLTSSKELAALKKKAQILLEQEKQAADALYVQATLEEVCKELGLELGDGFELTDFGCVAIATHDDNPHHGVRIQISPEGMIYTRVVSDGSTSTEQDIRAEESMCAKVHQVAQKAQDYGVDSQLKLERNPGDAPVEASEELVLVQSDTKDKTRSRKGRKHRFKSGAVGA